MDLYRYFARKDELIDLMADEAVAAAVLDEIPPDWRDALTAIAHALRAVCLAHPWVVTAAGRQPLIGPNVIRHVEQSLQATAALGLDWTKRLAIWRAVDSYTMGHAHLSPGRDHSEGTTADDPGWRAAAEAYLQGLAGSGNFPNLAAFGAAGLLHGDVRRAHLRDRAQLAPHRHRRRRLSNRPTQQPPADRSSPAPAEAPVHQGICEVP